MAFEDELKLLSAEFESSLKFEEPLKNHTTFKIGGPAQYFITPSNVNNLSQIIKLCGRYEVPFLVIGKGSNLLVSDEGIRGTVISLENSFDFIRIADETKIVCASGIPLIKACRFALEYSLSGLEFAFGIPGTVGGAAYMNAGAYGGEMKMVVDSCSHIDSCGRAGYYTGENLGFSYRKSVYTETKEIITSVTFSLEKGDPIQISEKMNELMARRKEKQPLEYPSAGSTFKRPEGNYASALIDQCGLKGLTIGDAQVSTKHAGFIVNRGQAKCSDVLGLIDKVKNEVYRQTGVVLECEVKIVN